MKSARSINITELLVLDYLFNPRNIKAVYESNNPSAKVFRRMTEFNPFQKISSVSCFKFYTDNN